MIISHASEKKEAAVTMTHEMYLWSSVSVTQIFCNSYPSHNGAGNTLEVMTSN